MSGPAGEPGRAPGGWMPYLDVAGLGPFLAGRRWAGARAGLLRVLDVPTLAPLRADPAAGDPPAALATVRVALDGGAPYELLVPFTAAAGGAIEDATLDPGFRAWLYDAVREGRTLGDGALVAAPLDGAALPPPGASRVSSAEQSNTSLVYPEAGVMLKLFRRVEAGENPDVEVGRFLARRDFPHTPRLLGTLTLRRPGGDAVVGMAQRLVPGAEDAWAHAVRAAAAFLAGDAGGDYGAEAARLGAVTRALHDALASDPADPDFAPARATAAHVARWTAAAERALGAAVRASEGSAAPGAAVLHARQAEVRAAVARAAAGLGDDAGAAVRHHGDYHLGQVIRGADGALYVIDFEGEPAKPLAERRARHSPLRDVAGMLRSFGYAAAFARRADAGPAAASRADAWEQGARGAFLAAYFTPAAGAGPGPAYLPASPAGARALLALFELEKLVYEVTYELQNRPDWVDIPLAGLARALGGGRAGGGAGA
jgi:maltose alpha-D-glucosyltransferase/alpha-amylase